MLTHSGLGQAGALHELAHGGFSSAQVEDPTPFGMAEGLEGGVEVQGGRHGDNRTALDKNMQEIACCPLVSAPQEWKGRAMTAVRILPLVTGRLEVDMRFFTGGEGRGVLPVLCHLVEHADGLVLFDTGMHPDLVRDTSRLGRLERGFGVDMADEDTLVAKLEAIGVRPSDISHVVVSHLHFDHAGGLGCLPDCRVVVQAAEWAAGKDADAIEQGIYLPADYDLGHDRLEVDGAHDLFGDGAVRCLPTPGHTAGHQSLVVELASGPVVLCGDCVYTEQLLDEMRTPAFGHDRDEQLRSMQVLADLRADGHRLVYGHDADQVAAFPAAGLV